MQTSRWLREVYSHCLVDDRSDTDMTRDSAEAQGWDKLRIYKWTQTDKDSVYWGLVRRRLCSLLPRGAVVTYRDTVNGFALFA